MIPAKSFVLLVPLCGSIQRAIRLPDLHVVSSFEGGGLGAHLLCSEVLLQCSDGGL